MTKNNTKSVSCAPTGNQRSFVWRSILSNPNRKGNFLSLIMAPVFLCLFLIPNETLATCYVSLPPLSENNGCVEAAYAPYSSYGSVEFMWAENVNGNIQAVTSWSTNTPLTYCPSSAGYYRMCARKVGCSTIYETGDVYVTPPGGGGGGGDCYKVKTKACGKFLDIAGGSTGNNAKLIQWSDNGGQNQRFVFDHLGNGVYRIIAQHSGKVLEAQYGNCSNGTKVVQGTWNNWNKQKWYLIDAGYGNYFIKNKKCGKYMDFYGSCGNGDKIELYSYYGDNYQKFKLIQTNDCNGGGGGCDGQITNVVINNLNGGSDINISNGDVLTTDQLPSNWNIEAFTSGSVESVRFGVSGSANDSHTENYAPYRYRGDNTPLNLGPGTYTFNVKAFQGNNASGEQCDEENITFTIMDQPCTGDITNLIFDDLGGTGDVIITNGASYMLSQLPSSFRLEALVTGEHESLGWVVSGDVNDSGTENFLPYTLPGGSSTPISLGVGSYTVTATLYEDSDLGGQSCDQVTVSFSIVEEMVCDNVTSGGTIGVGAGGFFNEEETCNGCAVPIIQSNSLPAGGSGALEMVWIKRPMSSSLQDCQDAFSEMQPFNVGELYDTWVANGSNPNDSQIGTTSWMFVSDGDADDSSLTLDCLEESTCFVRCARREDCTPFAGESNFVRIEINAALNGGTLGVEPPTGGDPYLGGAAICTGDAVPAIATSIFDGTFNGQGPNGETLEFVWLKTSNAADPGGAFNELVGLNVGMIYDNWVAAGSNPNTAQISGTSWMFATDNDGDDLKLALSNLDASAAFVRCARVVGDTRFCGESSFASITVEDCSPQEPACTYNRCNGVATITGTSNAAINSVKILDADVPGLPAVFECGTFLGQQCSDPIVFNLPNPNGSYIVSIICDDGNHYEYLNENCGGNLVQQNSDEAERTRASQNSVANENDYDRSRNAVEHELVRDFEIFPNPAVNEVYVGMKTFAGKPAQITILNNIGQVMQTVQFDALPVEKVRLDVSNLSSGLYFIRMDVEGEQELTKRIVVNKAN